MYSLYSLTSDVPAISSSFAQQSPTLLQLTKILNIDLLFPVNHLVEKLFFLFPNSYVEPENIKQSCAVIIDSSLIIISIKSMVIIHIDLVACQYVVTAHLKPPVWQQSRYNLELISWTSTLIFIPDVYRKYHQLNRWVELLFRVHSQRISHRLTEYLIQSHPVMISHILTGLHPINQLLCRCAMRATPRLKLIFIASYFASSLSKSL